MVVLTTRTLRPRLDLRDPSLSLRLLLLVEADGAVGLEGYLGHVLAGVAALVLALALALAFLSLEHGPLRLRKRGKGLQLVLRRVFEQLELAINVEGFKVVHVAAVLLEVGHVLFLVVGGRGVEVVLLLAACRVIRELRSAAVHVYLLQTYNLQFVHALHTIVKNCRKLSKIVENCRKLSKIVEPPFKHCRAQPQSGL